MFVKPDAVLTQTACGVPSGNAVPARRDRAPDFLRRLCFICCNSVRAAERASDALHALVAAYPDALARHDGTLLYWKDGTRMPVGAAEPEKSFEQRLRAPSILDNSISAIQRVRRRRRRPRISIPGAFATKRSFASSTAIAGAAKSRRT